VVKVFPLSEVAQAQTEFMQKQHFGKFVLVPWGEWRRLDPPAFRVFT